jgi:hypothetical protein
VALPVAGAGPARVGSGEGVAGGAHGVQRIRPGTVAAGGPLGPVELDDVLAVTGQGAGEAGAVAAGALDRPGTLVGLGVLGGKGEQCLGAGGGGRHRGGGELGAGGGLDDGGGVGVAVGVDPDDDLHDVCQHWHRVLLLGWTGRGWYRSRPGTAGL